ncbi:MAG: hypothetical protein KA751_04555 [Comamonas sp.]|nr:hypothetical protein [Comamonas sp.]
MKDSRQPDQLADVREMRSRISSAKKIAAAHLVISLTITGIVAVFIFLFWFPFPYRIITNSTTLFLIVVMVDIVCGPILTLILYNAKKTQTALIVDFSLIVLIQFSALAYGIHSLAQAKPIAVVFEVDRFRVVSAADIFTEKDKPLPDWVSPWGFSPPRLLGIRRAKTLEEKVESVNASLQGIEPSQRPAWWQVYALSVPEVLAVARPLAELQKANPTKIVLLNEVVLKPLKDRQEQIASEENLVWLPLVSRGMQDWVILLNARTAEPEGYMALNGFGQ